MDGNFVKSWGRFPELISLCDGVDHGWRNELWTWDTWSGFDEKSFWSSLAWEANLSSQAQPTPAQIVFRILKLSAPGLVGSGLPKAICARIVLPFRSAAPIAFSMRDARNGKGLAWETSVGVGWVWPVRLQERLPCLQRHLGGHAVLENSCYKATVRATQCVENFVTPGWTAKITKISTPWN